MSRRCYLFPANQNNKGFTLIELVITIGIVAIIMIPIFTLFLNSIKTNAMGEDKIQATMAAQKYMEEVKSYSNIDEIQNKYSEGDFKVNVEKLKKYSSKESTENNDENTSKEYILEIIADENNITLDTENNDEIDKLFIKIDGPNLKFYYNDEFITNVGGYKPNRGFKYHEIQFMINRNLNIEILVEIHNKEGLQYEIYETEGEKINSDYVEGTTGKPQIINIYSQKKANKPMPDEDLALYEINITVTKNNKVLEYLTGYIRTINGDIQTP